MLPKVSFRYHTTLMLRKSIQTAGNSLPLGLRRRISTALRRQRHLRYE